MKIAGIDVHKKVLMVVVIDASTPEEKPERRRFTTLPSDLRRLTSWLREQGVQEAVMESTAQYWRSVWLELEPHMLLHLAHAFSNRAPRGRKHDFRDAERLVRRLIADELILSFVPKGEQRIWRSLTRMKTQLRRDRVRLQNQIECLLEEVRIKLSSVVSDLLGASGLRILRALAAGETEPRQLVALGRRSVEVHRGAIGGCLDGQLAAHAPGNAGVAVGAAAVNRYPNRQAQQPDRASHEATSRGRDALSGSARFRSGFGTADHCRSRC
jgi:transposase